MLNPGLSTRFGLIRHAQTEWNQSKLIQGHRDSPLTPAGKSHSQSWGRKLQEMNFHRIITSDLGRTIATAEEINRIFNVPMDSWSGLREVDWGAWTGKRIAEIEAEMPAKLKEMEQKGWQFCPPGGESRTLVWQRSREALLAAASKWPGENILTVIHEGVIKCLLYGLAQRKFLPQEPALILPRHLHWLKVQNEMIQVEEINAMSL